MFEKNNKRKYGKIRKSDDRYSVAAGSGEPGSSLYGMKDFKSKTPHNVNPRASSTLNSIYGIKYDDELKQAKVEDTQPVLTANEVLQKALAESEKEEREEKIRNYKNGGKKAPKPSYITGKTDDLGDIYGSGAVADQPKKTEEKTTDSGLSKSETKDTQFVEPPYKEANDFFDDNYSKDDFVGEKQSFFDDSLKNADKDVHTSLSGTKKATPVKAKKVASAKKLNLKQHVKDTKKAFDIKLTKKPEKKESNKKQSSSTANRNKVSKAVNKPKKEPMHFDFGKLKANTSGKTSPKPKKPKKSISLSWLPKIKNSNKMPVAIIAFFVVVIVLYAFLRIPLSKLGGKKVSLYGIELNPGILVNNTDITTLSNGKIKQLLGNGKLNTDDKLVTIKSADDSFSIDYGFDEFDVVYDVEGTIDSAANFAKDTTSDNWWREYKSLEGGNVNFDVIHYNKSKLNSAVKAIAAQLEVPSVDATAKKVDGEFVVTKSSVGYTIDSNTIFTNVDKLIRERNFGQDVVFQLSEVNPRFNESNFSEIDNIIGSCTSEYDDSDENRVQNLKNACKKLNGIILYPDEEFSTNEHFLPFTEKNGWREAGTIVQGKIEDSIGGGMCQVSTALYDALLEAEVQITERYNHSLKVNYSEYGMDAALAGDYKDLCFKNDTGAPLYIEAYVTRSNVVINIYGKEIHDAGRRIEFESKLIDTIEPGDPIITYDSTLPEGTENITTYALKGRVYELYKKIYENGELKDTVKINTSNYLSRREEKTVGTKKADS